MNIGGCAVFHRILVSDRHQLIIYFFTKIEYSFVIIKKMRRYAVYAGCGFSGAVIGSSIGSFDAYNTLSGYKFYGKYMPDSRLISALRRGVDIEMSGKDFNAIFKDKIHVKFFNKEGIHHGMEYKDDLNIDVLPFYPLGSCNHGGLYFVKNKDDNVEKYGDLLDYLKADHKRRVYIPDHARVYVENGSYTKYKANMIVLGPKMEISSHII
jgi:hypothetical protein